jgi:hypothetical protein
MLPFILSGANGNADMARAAILGLIDAYAAATPPELDLVGRMISFGAAATDNLGLSANPSLSDRKILQYRANAIALNRSAEQCRKVLETMQAKREQRCDALAMVVPMPQPKPAPVSPLPPASPPPRMPPAQPQPSPNLAATAERAAAFISAVEGDPACATDIDTMRRNTRAMLLDLQGLVQDLQQEAPTPSMSLLPDQPSNPHHGPPA